jgi:hypothetical protein
MREARDYLAAHPSCELCQAEDLDEPATVAGLAEDETNPDLLRLVAVCELHRDLVMAAPPAG